jgi:hypothetical protein
MPSEGVSFNFVPRTKPGAGGYLASSLRGWFPVVADDLRGIGGSAATAGGYVCSLSSGLKLSHFR